MMQINLIPKKPFLEKYFSLLFIAIVGSFAIAIVSLLVWKMTLTNTIEQQQENIASLEQTAAMERERRTPDERLVQLQAWQAAAEMLRSSQPDWNSFLDTLADRMPDLSIVNSMEVTEDGIMKLTMRFLKREDIAYFMLNMKQTEMVRDLRVTDIVTVRNDLSDNQEGTNITEADNDRIVFEVPAEVPADEPEASYVDPLLAEWNSILDEKTPGNPVPEPIQEQLPTPSPTEPIVSESAANGSEDYELGVEWKDEWAQLEDAEIRYYEVLVEIDVMPYGSGIQGGDGE